MTERVRLLASSPMARHVGSGHDNNLQFILGSAVTELHGHESSTGGRAGLLKRRLIMSLAPCRPERERPWSWRMFVGNSSIVLCLAVFLAFRPSLYIHRNSPTP